MFRHSKIISFCNYFLKVKGICYNMSETCEFHINNQNMQKSNNRLSHRRFTVVFYKEILDFLKKSKWCFYLISASYFSASSSLFQKPLQARALCSGFGTGNPVMAERMVLTLPASSVSFVTSWKLRKVLLRIILTEKPMLHVQRSLTLQNSFTGKCQ